MPTLTPALFAALLAAAPSLSTTYPPAHDVRDPDRTIESVGKEPALLAYSIDGRVVATASGKEVRLWNARTGEEGTGELLRALPGAETRIVEIAFTAPNLLVAIDAGGLVHKWDPSSGQGVGTAVTLPLSMPVLRPGPEPWVAGVAGGKVVLYSHDTGALVKSFDVAGAEKVRALAFAPGGKVLAVAGEGDVRLWDVASGALLRTLEGKRGVRSMALSAERVAAGYGDGTVALWAADGREPLRSWKAHRASVNAVAFGNKGAELGTAGADRLVEVWDVETGVRLCTQRGHTGVVQGLVFNPNGQKMASTAADHTLRLWTEPLPLIPPADLEKITAALPDHATVPAKRRRKLLVFWRADAILHKGGVPAANKAIELLGKNTGAYQATFTRDLAALDPRVLAGYDAIVFNSTAHLVIPDEAKKQALLDFVRKGGGVVGIHAAIDMFKGWREGAEIVGATFAGHPWHPTGTWAVKLEGPDHPLLRAFAGKSFKMHDEFYELGPPYQRADRHVLLSLDLSDQATASVSPLHRKDGDFAVSWIKSFGKGRVFYCMFGHLGDPFQQTAVLQYYLDGIQYALGDLVIAP
jgi:type 1 glutamine amidotransferase